MYRNIFFVLMIVATQSFASMVRKVNLEDLYSCSERIFLAEVKQTSKGISQDKNVPFSSIEFSVIETYKGNTQKTIQIKQIDDMRLRKSIGIPVFTKGEKVIVFLPKAKASAALSIKLVSPFALGQGVFRVNQKKGQSLEKATIRNAVKNQFLFKGSKNTNLQKWAQSRFKNLATSKVLEQMSIQDLKKALSTLH